ncbi:hypothetical protein [Streptomyces goshikiensis]|uniref:hypothetical protein n=1 Tax=Streptomyces goshikiensis TaxID=1942 RepID=UPI0036578B66
MTHNYRSYLCRALTTRYGVSTDDWPPSAEYVVPLFSVIIDAVDLEEAAELFGAGIRAHRQATRPQTGPRGRDFAGSLALQLPQKDSSSLADIAAWASFQTIHGLVEQDDDADFETYLECALDACERDGGRPRREQITAAAGA